MFFYWLCYAIVFIPLRLIYPTKVIGRKNLPKKSKAILACNHRSNADGVMIFNHLYRRPYVLAKHTLFKKKFNAAILKAYGGIPVNREEVGISTIKTVLSVLKDEQWLLVFPEGTRKDINNDEQVALKSGTAMFALKSKAPVIPMWELKRPKAFHRNVLLIGEPVDLSEFEGQKLNSDVLGQASEKISQAMQKLRDDYLKEHNIK